MPIAFIIVLMAILLGGWYQSYNYEQRQEATLKSEASAIATNMLAYKDWINKVVKYQNDAGQLPYYERFRNFQGDAEYFMFLIQGQSGGEMPQMMTWFNGPMPGVSAYLDRGKIFLYYNPTSSAHASQRGVQSELLALTNGSFGVGKAIPSL